MIGAIFIKFGRAPTTYRIFTIAGPPFCLDTVKAPLVSDPPSQTQPLAHARGVVSIVSELRPRESHIQVVHLTGRHDKKLVLLRPHVHETRLFHRFSETANGLKRFAAASEREAKQPAGKVEK